MIEQTADTASARPVGTAVAQVGMATASAAPPFLTQAVLDRLLKTLERRHAEARNRLRDLSPAIILVDPTDLRGAFLLSVGPNLRLRLTSRTAYAQATIRGRFSDLVDLLEGRIDGDALFFSRSLAIEGDTALIVAVRNALDGIGIDLAAEIDALAGPLAPLLAIGRRTAGRFLGHAHRALLAPASQRLDAIERRLARLETGA